jgi:hypothetical protein
MKEENMKQVCAKSLITGVVALALVAIGLAPAYALDFSISGQVNQVAIYANDGDEDDFTVADNDSSSTRIRATGSEQFGSIKVGFEYELEAQQNSSYSYEIDQDSDGDFEWNGRKFNVYFDTVAGKIEIGQGSTASDGTAEVDLSDTWLVNYSSPADIGGGLIWKDDNGNEFLDTAAPGDPADYLAVGDTIGNFDGLSRKERIRYTTPSLGGAAFSTSFVNGGAIDAAITYAGEFGGNKLAAAVSYAKYNGRSDTVDDRFTGSLSYLAPFGLNLTIAYGTDNYEASGRDDAVGYYGKIGYKAGIHAVAIDYSVTEDMYANDYDGSSYSLGYVVNPWAPVELYAVYRVFMLDTPSGMDDPDDITIVAAGTRVKF